MPLTQNKTKTNMENEFSTEMIAGDDKPGFIFENDRQFERSRGVLGTGARFSKQATTTCAVSQQKEIGFQLQAEGSTAGVTPQSTRVRAKAARQPSLTFSINSASLSHERTLAKQKECEQQM